MNHTIDNNTRFRAGAIATWLEIEETKIICDMLGLLVARMHATSSPMPQLSAQQYQCNLDNTERLLVLFHTVLLIQNGGKTSA